MWQAVRTLALCSPPWAAPGLRNGCELSALRRPGIAPLLWNIIWDNKPTHSLHCICRSAAIGHKTLCKAASHNWSNITYVEIVRIWWNLMWDFIRWFLLSNWFLRSAHTLLFSIWKLSRSHPFQGPSYSFHIGRIAHSSKSTKGNECFWEINEQSMIYPNKQKMSTGSCNISLQCQDVLDFNILASLCQAKLLKRVLPHHLRHQQQRSSYDKKNQV